MGNVYLGRVQNVLPSMEAAFIDIGKGRNAVLYAGEVNWDAAGRGGGIAHEGRPAAVPPQEPPVRGVDRDRKPLQTRRDPLDAGRDVTFDAVGRGNQSRRPAQYARLVLGKPERAREPAHDLG